MVWNSAVHDMVLSTLKKKEKGGVPKEMKVEMVAIIQVTTQVVTETKTKAVFSVRESPKLTATFSNLAN